MVHPEGFEPPILGTGNLRFIQLSYGCTTGYFNPSQKFSTAPSIEKATMRLDKVDIHHR